MLANVHSKTPYCSALGGAFGNWNTYGPVHEILIAYAYSHIINVCLSIRLRTPIPSHHLPNYFVYASSLGSDKTDGKVQLRLGCSPM